MVLGKKVAIFEWEQEKSRKCPERDLCQKDTKTRNCACKTQGPKLHSCPFEKYAKKKNANG